MNYTKFLTTPGKEKVIENWLNIIGVLFFVVPAIAIVKSLELKSEIKLGILVIVLIAATTMFKVIDDNFASSLSSIIEIATLVGILIVYSFHKV